MVKVKEPQPSEYGLLRPGLILFTYLHLAPLRELTDRLLQAQVTGVAYETIREADGSLPLLHADERGGGPYGGAQVGAQYLEAPMGGRGVLLAGVPGVAPANVVILGGGVVGTNAAKIALGIGAAVTIIDKSIDRLRQLDDVFNGRAITLASNVLTIRQSLKTADLAIGAVLVPGASAPKIVRRGMIAEMKRGAVVVDVAIDQGGCFETSHATTHTDPIYFVDGVLQTSLRLEHARRRPAHFHAGVDQLDLAVSAGPGKPWLAKRRGPEPGAEARRQHLSRPGDPSRRGRVPRQAAGGVTLLVDICPLRQPFRKRSPLRSRH